MYPDASHPHELCDDSLTPADERQPGLDSAVFRRVMGHFPTGVTVVSAMTPEGPVGLSIGSFTSVSLDPPLVGFLPARTSRSWPGIRTAGRFAVSILRSGQEGVARQFAAPHDDRFDGVSWAPAPHSGAPILAGSAAWLDCSIEAVSAAGDHHFVLGRVLELGVLDDGAEPLVFFRGAYR